MKVNVRYKAPRTDDGICEFSKDPALKHFRCFTDTLPQIKWLWEPLRDATYTVAPRHRSKAMRGNWTLLYLYFVANGSMFVNVEPFYTHLEPELEIWKAFGFTRVPDYWTVWEHFGRLEAHRDAFERAAFKLSRLMAKKIPGYGDYLHTDASPGKSPARTQHICYLENYENCPTARAEGTSGSEAIRDGRTRRSERRALPTRLSADAVIERKQDALENDDDSADIHPDDADVRVRHLLAGGIRNGYLDSEGRLVYRTDSGHLMRTRDVWAGVRVYGKKGARRDEQWHGDYSQKTSDHLTHAVVAVSTHSCSINESVTANEHGRRTRRALGRHELAHAYDAGYSTAKIAEAHAREGVAFVHPGRNEKERKTDKLNVNRFGERPCQACGGPTKVIDVDHRPYPHWTVQCIMQPFAACEAEHKEAMSDDWLRLGLLPRVHPTFQLLVRSHQTYEGAHKQWSVTFGVAGKHHDRIPHRVSEGVRKLRPVAALFIQNFWLCLRLGLLPEVTRKYKQVRITPKTQDEITEKAMLELRAARMKHELVLPYGPAAEAVGWGDPLPASLRGRRQPEADARDGPPETASP